MTDSDAVFAHAMAAVVRRGDPEWTAEDEAALDRWRGADPRHEAALTRAHALWGRFDIVPPVWAEVERGERQALSRRAVLAGVAGLGAVGVLTHRLTRPGAFADYRTIAGETRELALADGSAVQLGTRSALSLGDSDREVALDLGEAYFRVNPAPGPFVVRVLGARVIAPARETATFALRSIGDSGLLAATRGNVTLSLPGQPPRALAQGHEMRFSSAAAQAPEASSPDAVASWRRRRLVFADAPLAEVVEELGRWRQGSVVTDPRVGGIRVTAVFDTDDIAGAFDSIARSLPVRVIDARLALVVTRG